MPVVCVTGATSGIGRATVERFVKEGWEAVALGRREERLAALAAEHPDRIRTARLDVRHRDEVEQVFKAMGDIDVLVNNAGLALGLEPAQECSLDDWDTMVDTNIKGLLYCTRAALPGMVARKAGHVVNLGSIAGTYAYPGSNVYGASKGFVLQFSRGLRCDLHGTGVRVTDIEPGLLESEFSDVRFKGDESRFENLYKNAHPLRPEDVADAIWWVTTRPAHVNVSQVEIMPTTQSLASARVFKG
ncbi:MAG TPA: SDR family NAD(P)-dependent oxidoreductase [Candidatus Bilophila faecipullorum]|uniref:SDR family NAD(P)-dependent oxidoreductase n=1 Tax=Candidatus Bilophila faecipullorum TaxID=2838482 RepID=A0A9D1QZF9_9BACT|nr:SDR family NAD(P)-dependent oxidoreductase [uncultured Bilophila sp.]HIW78738.1 SDR family NAD(P)-dependent oxidoreductase [Candidatus Bilophila faecipullorum]